MTNIEKTHERAIRILGESANESPLQRALDVIEQQKEELFRMNQDRVHIEYDAARLNQTIQSHNEMAGLLNLIIERNLVSSMNVEHELAGVVLAIEEVRKHKISKAEMVLLKTRSRLLMIKGFYQKGVKPPSFDFAYSERIDNGDKTE